MNDNNKKEKPKVRIIGVGNLHRSDDGVGPFVSECVAELAKKKNLTNIVCQSIGDDLMNLLSTWTSDEVVVMVDAVITSPDFSEKSAEYSLSKVVEIRKPGTFYFIDLKKEIPSSSRFRFSTHTLSPLQITKMAIDLDLAPKELYLYAVEGDQFSFSKENHLHPDVEASARKVAAEIIDKFCVGNI